MTTKHLLLAKAYDRKQKFICSANNCYSKTDPLQSYFAKQAGLPFKDKLHAEILALKRSGDKQVHTLSIERYGKQGAMLLAAPCPICRLAIKAYGVRKIVYTTPSGWFSEFV